MSPNRIRIPAALAALGLLTAVPVASASDGHPGTRHVLLISVDGLHQTDLAAYVARHPHSALAGVVARGTEYTAARTPVPSDSFPGLIGQLTGGDPAATGIYYDATYNHGLLPAGTTSCAGVTPGAPVDLTEDLDRDQTRLDAGQGLSGLPGSVLGMTGVPQTLLNQAGLPVDPRTCRPVQPHEYLKVNTVFEVARQAGLRTAWSDKHPAYEILNGPSGTGVQDLFTPEINSTGPAGAGDWTTDNAATQQYDGYKAQAVLNEIDGFDHSRTRRSGTPAVFGLNFQSVSTAQKLPKSGGQAGGYLPGGTVPGPVLTSALDFVDGRIGAFVAELRRQHLDRSTTIILSAKHGQSPTDPSALTRVADGKLLDGLNAAWQAGHPGTGDLVAASADDDAMLLWLTDRSPAAAAFAKQYLLAQNGTGTDSTGAAKAFTRSGLQTVYAGADAARYFGVRPGDTRVPDLFGVTQYGVVYTGGTKKIAEHGGVAPDDRAVPLVVSGPDRDARTVTGPVTTTQIAPTILRLLGLDPRALQAVRQEGTRVLPGIG
ncbi:type I phosphodiesterase/nucleotide pyrophosphatase [Amycolatopsis mediterranei S699]|uniref:Type I phosphodiesterase/nucleotide pyrophosphatase n=2 Tax=Amycolatopsis mediterranei TaxID=33910 RepID=A0A0H3DDD0_AMYMU|nr:alkaline phosphatase family protein [Amycolatopsis mediterranei]ADJ48232.1 type I phosphodiesterase/nucleotide pyrophosphatase [Amycolatopsis mediterranei U32]AEK45141.1 type I phosphodiesterase/nucleotide pyrophosphatase [Amycolatopsis mediterranei S699]AFO79943.1 type I phosphodiesterase/nucleotide pyrophosphatase [Amycolatopsis mediterranei S699]AGT87071.1 type I phosphodiesterase/nucleotide pyrophosphatase [Amycolatopsis mediterranei RB]KDO10718.1 phosphodiesterase [Amycolatopsis medite